MSEKPKSQKQDLALMKRDIVDVVAQRVQNLVGAGQLHLPSGYSAQNAIAGWWLKLQSTNDKNGRPALSVCTRDSVANATLDMVIQGLDPGKDQCYPVVYGDKLVCLRSYFGDEALLRRIHPEARVYAEPIYKGDELSYEICRGRKMVTKHIQKFENVGNLESIVGAYAVVEPGNGHEPHCEIMTIEQIKKAWSRGQNWPASQGKQSAHTDHPEEFAKKTVIARACKRMINSSNDSYLVRAVEQQAHLVAETEMQERMKEEANQEVIDLPPENVQETREEPQSETPEPEQESPSSPAARFADLIDEYDLDASKARKLAASIRKKKDVRSIGNEDFEAILGDAQGFLSSYAKQYRSAGEQPSLGGPGF